MDNTFDKMFYDRGELIGGVDEAGVSDIAGPLVAACVVLPKIIELHKHDLRIFEVDDSKKIPERYRKQYAQIVWENAIAIGIGEVSPSEIDALGKHRSISIDSLRAIAACKMVGTGKNVLPSFLLVDGDNKLKTPIPQECFYNADAKSLCVAAASIVAKVYRDEAMIKLHEEYPYYEWIKNKGHPCEAHFKGLDKHGIQPGIHRIMFYPFVSSPQFKENRNSWEVRRRKWKRATEKVLAKKLGGKVAWITKRRSSKLSKNLKSLELEAINP
jgi:ribonuclease HII